MKATTTPVTGIDSNLIGRMIAITLISQLNPQARAKLRNCMEARRNATTQTAATTAE